MQNDHSLPEYKRVGNLADYLKDLRTWCFRTQQEAAEYFHCNRTTISRYENEVYPLIPRHIGYLAGLLKLNVERLERNKQGKGKQFIEDMQEGAVAEANAVIAKYYRQEPEVQSWNELCDLADAYLSSQERRSTRVRSELEPYYQPAKSPIFIGRKQEFARALKGLNSGWQIIEIVGITGVGKTSLATEIFYACSAPHCYELKKPFQASVWITARGRPDQKEWFESILERIAQALNADYVIELSLEKRQSELNQLLQKNRTLIVLDNFETMANDLRLLRWLESDLPKQTSVLLSSRKKYIQNTWSVPLEGLSDTEAVDLIRTLANARAIKNFEHAKHSSLVKLVQITAGHPQAIVMAIGGMHAGLPLDEMVNQISQGKKTGALIIEDIVEWAWQALIEDNDAQSLLRSVAFFTSRISRDALTEVSGLPDDRFDEALARLIDLFWLNVEGEVDDPRYAIHPLIRTFLTTQPTKDPNWELQARKRWVDYYLDFLERRIRRKEIEAPYWRYLGGGKLKTIGLEWLNLLNVLEWADRQRHHDVLIEVMVRLVHYLDRRAYHPIRLKYAQKVTFAAQQLGQTETEALFRIDALGVTLRKIGRYEEAAAEIHAGLDCIEHLDSQNGERYQWQALGYAFLAKVYLEQARWADATKYITDATNLIEKCSPVIQHRVLITAGDLAYECKDYESAITRYLEASEIAASYRTDGDTDLAGVYRKLGFCYLEVNKLGEAEKLFKEVLSYKGQGGELNDIYATFGLGKVMRRHRLNASAKRRAQAAKRKLAKLSIEHPLLREIDNFLAEL